MCNFLAAIVVVGASYSAVNAARSAWSAYLPQIEGTSGGNHPEVCRLVKGVFEQRPTFSKYCDTWDVGGVLDFLRSLSDYMELTLKQLMSRTILFLSLLKGLRGSALHLLKVEDVELFQGKCVNFSYKQQHLRPGFHTEPAGILDFAQNRKICVVDHMKFVFGKD